MTRISSFGIIIHADTPARADTALIRAAEECAEEEQALFRFGQWKKYQKSGALREKKARDKRKEKIENIKIKP